MALRAVSIVSLESSIRARFDERINEIERSIQVQYQEHSSRPSRDGQEIYENRNNSNNATAHEEPDEVVVHQSHIVDRSSDESNANDNEPNEGAEENSEDMTELGDLGIPRPPGSRARSWDIRVEYDDFPGGPTASEIDQSSEASDTLSREIQNLSNSDDRSMSCCAFYRKHWVGHLVTGMLTGFLFIILGVVFLANGEDLPFYAGLTLILLGLAPCCMALNRYRYARLYEQERRRALRRLDAMRRAHRRHIREERMRQHPRYSDLPPSYDNLGFEADEDLGGHRSSIEDIDLDGLSLATTNGSFKLPTYEQYMEKKKRKTDKTAEKGVKQVSCDRQELTQPQENEEVSPPSYNENNNDVSSTEAEAEESQFVEITVVDNESEVIAVVQEVDAENQYDRRSSELQGQANLVCEEQTCNPSTTQSISSGGDLAHSENANDRLEE